MTDASRLADSWADALASWAIPQEILDAAPESPFGFPAELFVRRGERAIDDGDRTPTPTPTTTRALEALGDGGTVLDVGAGGGATCLPLARRCTGLIAVDSQTDMLQAITRMASVLGSPVTTVQGRWPDVACETPRADVVVCGHVAFNAPDLMPFVVELSAHAGRRVVIELTDRHPLAWMNDLWLRFHDVVRPERPRADDAEELCRALGFDVRRDERVDTEDMAGSGFERREHAIALMRRRLCLQPERDDEIATALGSRLVEHDGLWRAGPHEQRVVTL
ncbi:MAG: class I SAM-dependent methyltransferase, partial [Actinomycetota bacterium]